MQRKRGLAALVSATALAIGGIWAVHARDNSSRAVRHIPKDDRRTGPSTHRAGPAELAVRNRIAREESSKISRKHPGTSAALPSVPATTWVNLGPTDAPKEFNYFEIASVDSGRPNTIIVDPRDPNVVYMAVSGGGVWKTFDFVSAPSPTWAPTMDTLPNLAVGALALDPDHPDTLYAGNGDFVDTSGNTILKTTDGGGTWSDPIVLAGTYPAPNGVVANVGSIRAVSARGDLVFAATDVGLFRSSDAGASFALVDLPNAGGSALAESIWNIVDVGGGAWVASGMTACAVGAPPPGLFGANAGQFGCTLGNNVAIWRSDDGASWSPVTSLPPTAGTGRTTLAVGSTADPANTVIYAFVGSVNGDRTMGFWRSKDGGKTWRDSTGTLANPTLASNMDDSCVDINVGHNQTWYNQAIVVDPTNADHVLVGGNLCGMRTLDGTADAPTWELVSHWLPGTAFGETANGRLPYVHADWHTATAVAFNGQARIFAGTDGGIFSSTNLFDANTPAESVTWTHHNRGLATHLMYALASGDPVTANPFLLYAGLQDNGTRFRADPANPSAFNQAIGGDGIGATVHVSTSGTTYWGSVEFGRLFCKPAETDCSVELPEAPDDASSHWHTASSPVAMLADAAEIDERVRERLRGIGEDSEPFFIHYANVETDVDGQSVLTNTDRQVFVSVAQGSGFAFTPISQDLTTDPNGAGFSNVTASRTIAGLYGAAGLTSRKPFYFTTTGNTPATWTTAQPVFPTGTTARLTGPAALDFPPVLPAGTQPGQVFIGAFTGTLNDANQTPPPDTKGRLYRTTDFGQTWTSIVGADPAHRLPNVPVYVVKYDPLTATTIYAGTELGVYLSLDDGATWDRMGEGLPIVPVRDIYVAKNQEFIRVATYGRGLWEIYPSAGANHGAPGNGDYDRNLRIDWIDLAAMSSRLGVTPATTAPPFYSWIMDITGAGSDPPLQSIDGADLEALLAKFGGHP
ncbi:MAG: hypothetical protein JWO36_4539 [Myxococcales bacterium]|nr:hypothetical protein [Myxococcales bacterium]